MNNIKKSDGEKKSTGTSRVDINKYGATQEILTNARLCTPNLRSSELLIHTSSVHSDSATTHPGSPTTAPQKAFA